MAKKGPTLRAVWFGQQLRELRDEAGYTLAEAAEVLQRNPATLSRIEGGEFPMRKPDLTALLDFYGVADQRTRDKMFNLSMEQWQKGWWDGFEDALYDRRFVDYVWLESRAREIMTYDVMLVPGLLQTPEYARAVIGAVEPENTHAQVERWVTLRMERQQVLTGSEAPELTSILDEAVLRRPVGGPAVMGAQLEHLMDAAKRPNVNLRVLPYRVGAHPAVNGTFKLFRLADPYPPVAYVESLAGGVYVEAPTADRFTAAYAWLRKAALDTEASAKLIAAAAEDLE